MVCRHGLISGKVQGVGFRYFVNALATKAKLTGFVRNLPNGNVEVMLCGDTTTVEHLQQQITEGPPGSKVMDAVWTPCPLQTFVGFEIL